MPLRKVERPISKKSGNITDEQLKTIFLQHDVDNDGRLSREELTKAFKFLGSSFPGWRAIRCLRHVDSNGDGVINLDEVAQVVAYAKKRVMVPLNRDQLVNVFRSYDRDGDGRLTKEELKAAFRYLGSRWSSYRTAKALHKADVNKDGFININREDELGELVDYALECGYKIA
ncbi:hypothetical protein FEM48_Zijuj06G0030400 [Ziziphus jujuba var. spinosa]|uniref:EF-hand domain-containing protein n=1 Tax=Ziziphus jujuba var. spinosa TaxID=714518 RepID=A0A978V6S7_ZIZJJ|nr:hypothetical protein FEM48_Zijuj06G0030400 [Ziziphus jujuba var. spinosa]